jgi:hypothetical protein
MFIIRKAIEEAFAQEQMNSFKKKAVAFIMKHTDHQKPDAEYWFDERLKQAQLYDFQTEKHIMSFIVAAIQLGESFDSQPSAMKILQSSQINSEQKAEALKQYVLKKSEES